MNSVENIGLMFFEVIGEITEVERIAVSGSIRDPNVCERTTVRDVGESSKELP